MCGKCRDVDGRSFHLSELRASLSETTLRYLEIISCSCHSPYNATQSLAMSLDSLPDELTGLICGFCDPPEVKALRLTCQSLLKVANEYLLSEVVVFLNRESLEACDGITAHPLFSKTVRSLWLQGDRPKTGPFDEFKAEQRQRARMSHFDEVTSVFYPQNQMSDREVEEQRAQINAELDEIEARHNLQTPPMSDEQLRYHYEHACRLSDEAEALLHDNSLFFSLKRVLESCRQIETVYLTLSHEIRVSTAKHNKAFQKGLMHPFGDGDDYEPGVHFMRNLVLAAHQVSFKPKSLLLGDVSHYVFMREDEAFFSKLTGFFQDLEMLCWKFAVPCMDEDYTLDPIEMDSILLDFEESDRMSDLLKVASGLQYLQLNLPYHDDGEAAVPLPSVVSDTKWEQLKDLRLSGFETTLPELRDFLLRHADTLSTVLLGDVFLHQGEWPVCFASFAGKLPKLDQFHLRGNFNHSGHDDEGRFYFFGFPDKAKGNKYSRVICRYIKAGGEEFPPRPEMQEISDEDWSSDDEDMAIRMV